MLLNQSFACERLAGVGLQVPFEGEGSVLVAEADGHLDLPRLEFPCVHGAGGIVMAEAVLQVGRVAGVGLFGRG